ncbi:MAG: MCE family protein [Lautropia sp.]|nr:MAG: MCE family protein [Pseudomonadota bacterium]MBC6960008.1 MCE family protein [Lautropia sp.]MCL4701916.1 MCE family protein [Burkholderiaceae bacterium]MCZ2412790.1 MlaD family protein [Burkholderiales bacterium]MDL1907526.1 MCE family protein [Betaproteobacteria bacterium PRO1]
MTEDQPHDAEPVPNVGVKATLLLAFTIALLVAFLGYVLYARGTFEETQRLVLMADNAEGVSVGSDLTFSGFPVGRVQRIELARTGQARIEIDVPRSSAQWLRSSSVFTLERGLVGGARLRAFTGDLGDDPLPDGAVRAVLRGDTTDELPALVASVKRLVENVERMTTDDSDVNRGLQGLRTLTDRMAGRYGMLTALLGSEEEAKKVIEAIGRTNEVLASVDALARRLDGLGSRLEGTLATAERAVLGDGGVLDDTQRAVQQVNAMLDDARQSLARLDALLADAQAIAGDTRAATADLQALRTEIESSLRKAGQLIDEINRKWPFSRDTELRLP